MRRWMPTLAVLLLLLPSAPVRACLNDRDTDSLVNEGKNLPDVIQVITGHFERNPPLFYEMRIRRETEQIQSGPDDPTSLPYLYDDVAVAYDRLGKDDEAIDWIERKRKLIPEFARKYPSFVDKARWNDLWYRYHANCGTFWAHHWLRGGAKPERIGEMETARYHIAEALKINPNAHFGRERFQLRAMEWILALHDEKNVNKDSFGDYLLSSRVTPNAIIFPEKPEDIVTGLSGLIVLGNAWESVDIFDALAHALYRTGKGRIAYLANLRVRELLRQGCRSLGSSRNVLPEMYVGSNIESVLAHESFGRPPAHLKVTEEKFNELRAEAEQWQKARTDYMLPRLKRGLHPDVEDGRNEAHSDFWRDFPKTAPPSLDIPWYKEFDENLGWFAQRNSGFFIVGFLALVAGVFYLLIRLSVKLVRYLLVRFRGL